MDNLNFNYLNTLQFISTNKGIIRADKLVAGMIVKGSGDKIQKIESIEHDEVVLKEILFDNGQTALLYNKAYCETIDGQIQVSQIREGNFIKNEFFNYFGVQKTKQINWDDDFYGKSLQLKIPKEMTKKFAMWLGIVIVASKISEKSASIEIDISKYPKKIEDLVVKLTKDIFDLTPNVLKLKDGRRNVQISSRNLVKFIHSVVGKVGFVKKAPAIIQESSIEHQLYFMHGLSLKSFYDKKRLVIYSGLSKYLADYVAYFFKSLGYQISMKKNVSGNKKNVYYVYINSKHKKAIKFQTILLGSIPLKANYIVKVPEGIEIKNISKYNPSYRTIKGILEKNIKVCAYKILQNIEMDNSIDGYFLKVKSVKVLKKECVKILLSSNTELIVNNILTELKN